MQQADSFTDLKILNMDPWALGRHENLVIMLERCTLTFVPGRGSP
uniref:Uncharacterized protein n=1 Tax=Setaria italica TaxID=4555 RepID=K3ZF88_SETIT